MSTNKRNKAFTLAEVLITLGIIGVVAALTIPILMNKSEETELQSALKKNISVISSATAQMANDNGATLTSLFGDEYSDNLKPFENYLSIIKKCDSNLSDEGCWHEDAKWYDYYGAPVELVSQTFYLQNKGAVLKDGSFIIAGSAGSPSCETGAWISQEGSGTYGWSSGWPLDCAILLVDVNGHRGPNRAGKDIFSLSIRKNGLVYPGVYKLFQNHNAGLQCAGAVLLNSSTCP